MFKIIYEVCDDIIFMIIDGCNILYIVVYYGSYDICEYILIEKKELYDKIDNN